MKPHLLEHLQCPDCGEPLALDEQADRLTCTACPAVFPVYHGIPLFTPLPAFVTPAEKIERSPDSGTPWRQANWRFLQEQLERLPAEALILDVGAGRGDFSAALQEFKTVALEIYPYPEVDIVVDLTRVGIALPLSPLRPASFDAILLLNVLEHVYDTHALLGTLAGLLKPGGVLLVAIPFMVKMHQIPIDFVRYTHFAMQRLGDDHSLAVERLDGYYDPLFFLGEGLGNIRNAILPPLGGNRRRAGRALLAIIQFLANQLGRVLGPGMAVDPASTKSMAPTGYHVIYRKAEAEIS